MPGVSFTRVILPIGVGFALKSFSSSLSVRGDLAHALGDNATALTYHLTGLALLVAALGCFVFGLVSIFRKPRPPRSGDAAPTFTPATAVGAEPAFDPDAVIARYLASKQAAAPDPNAEGVAPRSFGRKGA